MLEQFSVSVVTISETMAAQVAERTGRTVEAVWSYIRTDQQDDELLRAFLFFGVAPFNKRFRPRSGFAC